MEETGGPPARLQLLGEKETIDTVWDLAGKSTYTLGRGPGNDIQLPHTWVSRNHAMIQVEANGAHNLIDLGSSNGTFVNGRRIYTPTRLGAGDIVSMWKTKLRFLGGKAAGLRQLAADDDLENATVAFLKREIVTVLVCDIRDFTRLSAVLGDGVVPELLRLWTRRVNETVCKHNGLVDKFIGDAVMAMWVGKQQIRDNILQALATVLDIAMLTREIGRATPGIPWDLRIGAALNTGEAVVGNIGVDHRGDFTVVGDTVNVAFRLEEMTDEANCDLLMGGQAGKFLEDAEKYFKIQERKIRGKDGQLLTYGCTFSVLRAYLKNRMPPPV